jgi:glutathione synthase/RimK-type ligase-like ATP-grasp enzyme
MAVDYRYGLARMEPCQVPNDVATRCLSLVRSLGLLFAGVDLRQTAHGRYVTFQLAEVAVPRTLFAEILRLIGGLRPRPAPT